MAVPAVGDAAPDFTLPTDGDETIRLADLRGRTVVVYFYPADDTKGCTTEAIDFTSALPEFATAGATIIGISPDSPGSHDKFKAKHKLGVTLASDVDRAVIDRYGAWGEKTLYGRKFMGVIRSTFLIGPDGRIRQVWRNVRVNGHAAAVLEAVKSAAA